MHDEQYQAGPHILETNPDASDYIKSSDHLTKGNHILHNKNRLYVPQGLVSTSLESEHDSRIVGHFGVDKTVELIRSNVSLPLRRVSLLPPPSVLLDVRFARSTSKTRISSFHQLATGALPAFYHRRASTLSTAIC